jgi:hypothetical protein
VHGEGRICPANRIAGHPDDDERQRRVQHQRDQALGDAWTVETSLVLKAGKTFRQATANRARRGLRSAAADIAGVLSRR